MDGTADELAGVVALFGGLTRAELERALAEIAFRADGQAVDEEATNGAIESALDSYALMQYEPDPETVDGVDDGESLLIAGPTAFPREPEHAEDVPHILEVDRRHLDREAVGRAARARFRREIDAATDAGDHERLERLLDVSYDLESWAPIDLGAERRQLDEALGDDSAACRDD